ncbi:hypothetical protein EWM64_g4 [Hericium alpestre]|uniref:Peptidase S54 rhomboid domain-containing protein n=1 Tax=Hericium alpestre TaxID=135208 RepID=A0A4Z0AA69_9AGAM|nr:hypothetical protein EWM64_g4 [Hericium alpestre]
MASSNPPHDRAQFDAFGDYDYHQTSNEHFSNSDETPRSNPITMPVGDVSNSESALIFTSGQRPSSPPDYVKAPTHLDSLDDWSTTPSVYSHVTPAGENRSYYEDPFNPYTDAHAKTASTLYNDKPDDSLVQNASGYGKNPDYQDLEYAEPFDHNAIPPPPAAAKSSPFDRFTNASGKYPLEQQIEAKKRGPTVNPMLGPSESALIRVGARFPPCMKDVQDIPLTTQFPCLNDTANPPDKLCTIEDVCGFGGFNGKEPNQWWRFITPIFLHAGIIHILLNMLAQLTAAAEVEREMGSPFFFIVYFAAGIFGNVLGGNFSLVGVPSVGASGAIFGVVAVSWIDLFGNWQFQYRPLVFMIIELIIGIGIGYIPYVDNFAHLGGFLMGILTGMTLYPIISTTKTHRTVVWFLRLAAIPLAVVLFVVLIRNFYTSNPYADEILHEKIPAVSPSGAPLSERPTLLVLGSGLWYLRYADTSGGLSAWEANIENILGSIQKARSKLADEIVILPIEDVISSKLSYERASTMLAPDRDAMNSDLYHRIYPVSSSGFGLVSSSKPRVPVSLPLAFNEMLDPSQTEDGLHFSDAIVRAQANILLNLRCNEEMPKVFPLDKTCCRSYPMPSVLHFIVLAAVLLWGYTYFMHSPIGPRKTGTWMIGAEKLPPLVVSGALAATYLADRTGFWLKEQKQFDPWTFGFLNVLCLGIGLVTVKRADKDLGFLNREQTDEWKGWMQIAILIYHYFGASKISGIYNPIRVLVAAYLFMTGYGHTTFYVKKADFGFLRVAQIMVRLNLFTLLLAYTMNTDYISYYFAPLVSMWYLIIYGTMAVGSQFNDRTIFLVGKILVSMGLVSWFMAEPWLLEMLFDFLARFCHIRWSAKEWAFRFNLDLWIVYFGMFSALAFIKIREHRLTDHLYWPLAVKVAIGAAALVMLWFFGFELAQPNKFVYNGWHPYVSFLPIAAFVVLRNANVILRSASSRAFAFIGTCSLETFIIQYHLWLAADTKGILIVIPWTRWRSLNMAITAVMFVYISHHVANATGEITAWICGTGRKKQLPTTTNDVAYTQLSPSSRHDRETAYPPVAAESVPLTTQNESARNKESDGDADGLPEPPSTPMRPRWVDRLAEGSSPPNPGFRVWGGETTKWRPDVHAKVIIGLVLMWVLNMLWPTPQ